MKAKAEYFKLKRLYS